MRRGLLPRRFNCPRIERSRTGGHVRAPRVNRLAEFHHRPLAGRVEDWRAGLGRSLCSRLSRPFVCECHNISTMPTFPVPATSNAACGFPALRSPVCFAPRVMGPILPGRLSALTAEPGSC